MVEDVAKTRVIQKIAKANGSDKNDKMEVWQTGEKRERERERFSGRERGLRTVKNSGEERERSREWRRMEQGSVKE